ncbi:hypothetical protein H2Y56_21905 [Pectobacterium aroidearum]|uniref:Uncharacterized protein n=1 Tax=Pectobacterium aroidearum TaxID=1201031 RepID=A0ABR5ZJI0_9GAMM|nr:hypothetical protein [Pectobacterium aroidearum]MBA5234738.1 hypothetical protein [Pectobacterium aroidearum]MBA5739916.1 hypothetical protein [Pectobacterium aroidearum]
MSVGGIRITNKDGSRWVFDHTCTIPALLGEHNQGGGYPPNVYNTGIVIPENYSYYVWMGSTVSLQYRIEKNGGRSQRTPWLYSYNRMSLNEKRELIISNDYYGGVSFGAVSVFVMPENKIRGSAGVRVAKDSSISSITDVDGFAFVAWKGDVELFGGWTPSLVDPELNMYNCLVFFYTTDPNITIFKGATIIWNNGNNNAYYLFNATGSQYGGSIKAKVVIFSNKKLRKTKAGLRIYSRITKKLIYDSGNEIMVSPKFISFKDSKRDEFTSIPDVKRPMYTAMSIGSGYENHWFVSSLTLASDGYKLAVRWGMAGYDAASFGATTYQHADSKLIILDAENYFVF